MSNFAWPLPVHYTSSDLDCFKVIAVSNNFDWKFHVLFQLSWNFIGLLSTLSRSWIYHYFFFFCTYSREIIDVFLIWQKLFHWLFHRHCSNEIFQTLHNYNLAWGLPVLTRFDDLNIVSRSQVYQTHKLQIVF